MTNKQETIKIKLESEGWEEEIDFPLAEFKMLSVWALKEGKTVEEKFIECLEYFMKEKENE
jgi:hypothetical protein